MLCTGFLRGEEYMMNELSSVANLIHTKARNRKIAFRWKDADIEAGLAKYGIKADLYISDNAERIKQADTEPSVFLEGKSGQYYLVIMPSLKQSAGDNARYEKYGFHDVEDILWLYHLPTVAGADGDLYGNRLIAENDVGNVTFVGFGSEVRIGKNARIPRSGIVVGMRSHIAIGENTNISGWTLTFSRDNELNIGKKCSGGGERVFLNIGSSLEIGDYSTFGSGLIRTGRNQAIRIGKDCMFSWDTAVLAHDGHMIFDLDGNCLNNTAGSRRESVTIGDHVWVGGEAVFLPGTKMGSGSICGYRSVIKGNFPNNVVIGGYMAKVLQRDRAWHRDNIWTGAGMFTSIPEEYRQPTEAETDHFRSTKSHTSFSGRSRGWRHSHRKGRRNKGGSS